MDPTDIGLFRAAEQRLQWVDRRQQVLAQNVANANTPGYQPRDVAPFALALGAAAGGSLAQTAPGHLSPPGGNGSGLPAGSRAGRPAERAPAGNAVGLEEQLGKVADTASVQALVVNLHRSYQSMMRVALGRAG